MRIFSTRSCYFPVEGGSPSHDHFLWPPHHHSPRNFSTMMAAPLNTIDFRKNASDLCIMIGTNNFSPAGQEGRKTSKSGIQLSQLGSLPTRAPCGTTSFCIIGDHVEREQRSKNARCDLLRRAWFDEVLQQRGRQNFSRLYHLPLDGVDIVADTVLPRYPHLWARTFGVWRKIASVLRAFCSWQMSKIFMGSDYTCSSRYNAELVFFVLDRLQFVA